MDYFERKLDDKNRLTIPAEIRHEFEGGRVVLTRGFDKTIFVYPRSRWTDAVEPGLQGDIVSEDNFRKNMQLRQGKVDASMDTKQGRIIIDQHLLDHAGIGKSLSATRIGSSAGSFWALQVK